MKSSNKTTDCLFIHVPNIKSYSLHEREFFVNCIAMGVFSMCNELKKNDFLPQVVHLGVEKALDYDFSIADYIKENNIKIVGLSLHWYYQTYDTLLVAQYIKKLNPDIYIFLGGITSSAFAEDILKDYPEINTVIKGEGEKPIVELIKRITAGNDDLSKIPNLYWKDMNGKIHKNKEIWFANEEELDSFDFDGLEYLKNYETYLRFPISYRENIKNKQKVDFSRAPKTLVSCLGRGCPGNCTWCGGGFDAIKIITGRNKITLRSPSIVAKEILHLKNKYNLDIFYFSYDPFPDKQDFLVDLFEILGKEMPNKINILFECFGLPTKEFVDAFKKNLGEYSQIMISPELGDEKMRYIHKAFPFSNNDFFACLNYIMSKDIYLKVYFTSLPFENKESINTTIKMVNMLKCNNYPKMKVLYQEITNSEPYTPWSRHPEIYGETINLKTLSDYVKNSKHGRDFL